MLYPCIENFGKLVNSLLFRLAIQVSILYMQILLETSVLSWTIHIGWKWNGYDGHHIQLTLHCRFSSRFQSLAWLFGKPSLGWSGLFSHITVGVFFLWTTSPMWWFLFLETETCSHGIHGYMGICDDVGNLRPVGCCECHTKISRVCKITL